MKQLWTPLKRENLGMQDDPQFSSYFPSEKWIVFFDAEGHSNVMNKSFRTKKDADEWIIARGR